MDLDETDPDKAAAAAAVEYAAKASLYIGVNVKFYDYKSTMSIGIGPTDTAESLMIDIKGFLVPPEQFQFDDEPFTIRDEDVMLIFQGVDLLSEDPTAPLHSFGIQEEDVLVILHRGQFIGYEDSQSDVLQSLVGTANRAADSSISIEEFINRSSDRKIIFVEIPLSEGIYIRMSTDLKFKGNIKSVKSDIWKTLADQATYGGDGDYLASSFALVQFDLHFCDKKLSWESTLDECGIRERDSLKLSWIFNGLEASIALQTNDRKFFGITNIKYSDTVDQIKARFCQVTGVPPEKQLLRYQKRWLKEDSKSLAEYGIIFCPSVVFPWQEHINAVNIFVRADGTPLPWEMNDLEHNASAQISLSSTTVCWCVNCPWHQSESFAPEFCQLSDGCLA